MALTFNIENTTVGAAFNAAYAKIVDFHGQNNGRVMVVVDVFASQSARQQDAKPVHRFAYDLPVPNGDLMPGLYASLKSMPEFEGAQDS